MLKGADIYFSDHHSPWQHNTNKSINGLMPVSTKGNEHISE